MVAAEFCVQQKQSPEVAVLAVAVPGKGRHSCKPQPAPAGAPRALQGRAALTQGLGIPTGPT